MVADAVSDKKLSPDVCRESGCIIGTGERDEVQCNCASL